MAYGMEIRNAAGTVIYDSTSVTWIQIGFFTIAADATITGTTVFPGAEEFTEVIIQRWFLNTPPTDQEALAHEFDITTNSDNVTISVQAGNEGNQQQGVLILGR